MHADVVVVGAGQGGAQTAMALRQLKYAGSILVIGAEPELPYGRPALSKEYLADTKAFEKMLLRPEAFWKEKNVEFVLGARITTVDANAKSVTANDGRSFTYGSLVWATGGRPRALPVEGRDLRGIHYVRDRADVDRIKAQLGEVNDVAPVLRPTLPIPRRRQQPVDELLVGVGVWIGDERLHVFRRRREADEVEVDAPDQRPAIGLRTSSR
jgi:3-phenylpropionate/trans-cinnamate dioxygenase ferredoxin reductase subunit